VSFFAVLDACVLYPYSLRDTLLRFAEHEFYVPLWSDRILEEMERNIVKDGVAPDRAARMRSLMEAAFEGASVAAEAIEAIEPSMTNQDKDRHVLAAAVTSEAEVVVTANLKDFPQESADPHGIEIQHPDEFLVHLFDLDRELAAEVIERQASDQRNPPMSVAELLGLLERAGVPRFSALVRSALAL
jgi:predicted nucleic acid-binding protein